MTNIELKEKLKNIIGLLNIPGIGRRRFHKLINAFGTPSNVLSAPIIELEKIPGISHSIAYDIKSKYDNEKSSAIAAKIVQLGWTVFFSDQPDYPQALLNIPKFDIPPILFGNGVDYNNNDKAIAIVGTRHPTEQGRLFTFNLAASLAKAGIAVISGMAEGIDAAAHKGALDAGGSTIAIWGNSLDIIYPPSNKNLALQIRKKGTIISEYLPNTSPDRSHFPERNRIISGLSNGVVVIEAGLKSGALITADHALAQGRELFAVPGPPGSKMSEGTNKLIKNGTKLITSLDDIFDELPHLKGTVLTKKFVKLPDLTIMEKKIINLFTTGPQQVDQISRATNLPISELMEFLLALELKGVVQELSGKRFILSEDYS